MRAFFSLVALLCLLSAQAIAGTRGIGGEWHYYGEPDRKVRIDEKSGLLEDGVNGVRYVLQADQGARRRAVRKGVEVFLARPQKASATRESHSDDARDLLRMHDDVLLFLGGGVKNPILLRTGARFAAPKEKIRGRWHYAAQLNETYYYDAEFDLDARKLVDISRSEDGAPARGAGRSLELLLDAKAECALQSEDAVYHFARLGANFLVLAASHAKSSLNGFKILMEGAQSPGAMRQEKTGRERRREVKDGAAEASGTKGKKRSGKNAQTRRRPTD